MKPLEIIAYVLWGIGGIADIVYGFVRNDFMLWSAGFGVFVMAAIIYVQARSIARRDKIIMDEFHKKYS